ncbi:hypothetical protein TNCT6_23210 [Streptomyces sp. 6-11-2]|nr:hypothetical protein TNCT6_23210 [Streptomyces sp. 6-11-2]
MDATARLSERHGRHLQRTHRARLLRGPQQTLLRGASGAKVCKSTNTGSVVGRMYSDPSWFVCKSDGGRNHGGPHPTRWVHTQADNGARGWMSGNDTPRRPTRCPRAEVRVNAASGSLRERAGGRGRQGRSPISGRSGGSR